MEIDSQTQPFAHSLDNASPGAHFSPSQQHQSEHLTRLAPESGQTFSESSHRALRLSQQRPQSSWSSVAEFEVTTNPAMGGVATNTPNIHTSSVDSMSSPYAPEDPNMTSSGYPFYSNVHHQPVHPQAERPSLDIASLSMAAGSEGTGGNATTSGQSPIDPSPHPSTASTTLSPITPRSPSDLRPSTSSTVPPHSRGTAHANGLPHPQSQPSAQRSGNGIFAYGLPEPVQSAPHNPANAHASTGFEVAMHRNASTLRGMSMGLGLGQGHGIPAGISTLAGSTPHMSASTIPRKRALAPLDVSEAPLMNTSNVEGCGYSPVSANHLGMGGLSLAIPATTPAGGGLYKYDDDADVDLICSYDSTSIVTPATACDVYPQSHYGISQAHEGDAEVSPVDGSLSTGSSADDDALLGNGMADTIRGSVSSREGQSGTSNFINGSGAGNNGYAQIKSGSNNFVAKLYQMINDPKSAHFIQWTELGTSFVVSNVAEFSRSILGVHFKHNNFSSFVRQLNMYGFHKINRTPRNQRGPASAGGTNDSATQTWEFSHQKFLRGRPDLLEAIKRKALEPDPASKARIELPGEVAAQLAHMRENQRRVVKALDVERAKVEKLVGVVRCLSDVVARLCPGSVPPFPPELWEMADGNPSIFVSTPSSGGPMSSGGRYNMMHHSQAFPGIQNVSPNSSPTGAEFGYTQPQHQMHAVAGHGPIAGQHHLRHAHSMHQMSSYATAYGSAAAASDGGSMDFDGADDGDRKRQRTETETPNKLSRARSDSVPLSYANSGGWGRPRTGSGMVFGSAPGTIGSGMTMTGLPKRDGMLPNISGQHGHPQGQSVGSPLATVSPKTG